MAGYAVETLDEAKTGLLCSECGLILNEAVQTPDGVRLCQKCFKESESQVNLCMAEFHAQVQHFQAAAAMTENCCGRNAIVGAGGNKVWNDRSYTCPKHQETNAPKATEQERVFSKSTLSQYTDGTLVTGLENSRSSATRDYYSAKTSHNQ